MQTFGLPRQITRGAALASRPRQRFERRRRGPCRRRSEIAPLPVAEAGGPQPPQAVLAPPAHPAPARLVGSAGDGRPGDTRRLPDVGQGQDRRPAAAQRARGKREHHGPHPQDPDGARRGHPGPELAPQWTARRPAPQASRQTPAQGPQAHRPRRDRPTRHPSVSYVLNQDTLWPSRSEWPSIDRDKQFVHWEACRRC